MFTKLNEKREGFTLIELLIVVAIIGILAAIAIPQYARYRKGAQDNAAQSAYNAIALAQEAYFAKEGTYIPDYTDLRDKAGLVRDQNVVYGALSTGVTGPGAPGFAFEVKHKADGSTLYQYDSSSSVTVKSIESGTITNTVGW